MQQVEEVDGGRVLALDEADLQVPHEPGRRHPEVVADHDDRLDVLAVALPQRGDQLGVLLVPAGEEPLLELVEDQQDLLPRPQHLPPPQGAPAHRRASRPAGRSGQTLRRPRSSRASVSSGVAST